ncbi:hypothetical protein GGF46_004801 [Coemansia sp. RSA 552]|nr:hypothetical protein GGF46_004801 [Coemansia sp. RSA 552]
MSGVVSENLFSLLPDNATSGEVDVAAQKKKQQQQAAKKPTKTVAPRPERASETERVSRNQYPKRGGFRGGAVAREPRAVDQTFERESRGRQGAARGGRSGSAAPRGRGRQFDRHSATGLVDSAKKEKQGWLGSADDLPEDEAKAAAEAKKDQDGVATPAENEEAAEPEEVVKSLDAYLNERNANSVDAKKHQLRKANEGVDKSQLKQGVELVNKEEEFFPAQATRKVRKQKERQVKATVNIEQRFNDQSFGGRGAFRGGRGGARPGGRGGAPSGRQQRVNLNDQSAFPSLG